MKSQCLARFVEASALQAPLPKAFVLLYVRFTTALLPTALLLTTAATAAAFGFGLRPTLLESRSSTHVVFGLGHWHAALATAYTDIYKMGRKPMEQISLFALLAKLSATKCRSQLQHRHARKRVHMNARGSILL